MQLLKKSLVLATTFLIISNLSSDAQDKNKANNNKNESVKEVYKNLKPKLQEENKGETTIKEDSIKSKSISEGDSITNDLITIQTEKGLIKIKLFVKEAPITSNNIIDLAQKGFYNGTVFHRVVEGFVIQGGDPLGDGTGNYIDPGTGKPRYIKLETHSKLKFDKKGRVGMARTSDPDSASCQFFIALQPLPSLDPGGVDPNGYAVFGQVTEDSFETIDKIVDDFKPAFPGSDRPAKPVRMNTVSVK